MLKIGVDTFIWTENFSAKDLWIIPKAKAIGFAYIDFAVAHPDEFPAEAVKALVEENRITPITTTTLGLDTNLISPDPAIRANGVRHMKKMVDLNIAIGSKITGGVNYAAWGYITRKPRTGQEWNWSVTAMREVARYAMDRDPELILAVECINRFETHFLNVASDAVQYCKDVGTDNLKVHLDCFHMNIEESSFSEAFRTCGKKYLGYMHVNENNRGIPGTGMVPFREIFTTLREIGYTGPLVIESFDPSFEELSGNCAIWRKLADSGEQLAIEGLANLQKIAEGF